MLAACEAFVSAPAQLSRAQTVGFAERALERCEAAVDARAKLGLTTLATIAATATFLGLAGTVLGMLGSFRGYSGPPEGLIALTADGMAHALVPTAVALAIALLAYCSRGCLTRLLEKRSAQNAEAALRLVAYLNAQFRQHSCPANTTQPAITGLLAGVREEVPYDRSRALFYSVGLGWLAIMILFAVLILGHFLGW